MITGRFNTEEPRLIVAEITGHDTIGEYVACVSNHMNAIRAIASPQGFEFYAPRIGADVYEAILIGVHAVMCAAEDEVQRIINEAQAQG